jgi:hypothetical protein
MRDDLSHLPQKQRDEFARARRILMEEFEKAIALGNQAWKRGGRILKLVLSGSVGSGQSAWRSLMPDTRHPRAPGHRAKSRPLIQMLRCLTFG